MRTFSDQDLLAIWEIGLTQHPLDRALTLLTGLFPGQSRQALAHLSIGQRDGYLLTLHEQLFGPRLAAQARCPACQNQVEFMLNTTEIRIAPSEKLAENGEQPLRIETDGWRLVFRLPTSLDLAAIAEQQTIDTARHLLAQRCLVSAVIEGEELATTVLPEAVISLLATQIARHDPQAEIELALVCPACGQTWPLLFDIATFLWNKWDVQARRLLREVHLLASAYGWSEIDILNLSAERRQFYLELVTV